MARKSRKVLAVVNSSVENLESGKSASEIKKRIPTAIYVRLSVENNGRTEDDSLENQIALCHSYVMDHSDELDLIDTYADNGHTGTNFDRPEFIRLIDDVNHGKIGCIVVKDLSRFGRNYVETGIYIENIFPKLNVKLIAINDSFDSSKEADRQSISVPVKNMVNEMYSRDQSRKIKAANKIRFMKENVLPMGPSPYGYSKNEKHTQYLPDENSDYIRVLFQWEIMGVSRYEIVDRLNLLEAPLPRKPHEPISQGEKWTLPSLRTLLTNPTYTGNLCFGRTQRRKVGTERGMINVPESQWIVHPNTHEALVPKEDFEKLIAKKNISQKTIAKKMKSSQKDRDHFRVDFNNMVYCAECNRKMIPRRPTYKLGERYTHIQYECTSKRKMEKACYNCVSNDFLRVFVMDQVKHHIRLLADRTEVIKSLKESKNGKDLKLSIDKQILALGVKLEEAREKQAQVYEDYKSGLISEEDFKLIHEKRVMDVQNAEENYKSLNAKKDVYIRTINNFMNLMEDIQYNPGEDGFDEQLVQKMVERINVYAGNRYEVIFKYKDAIDLITEVLENSSDDNWNISSSVNG